MGYQPQRPWASCGPPLPTFPEDATAFLEDCVGWWAWLEVATPEQIEDEPASGHRWLRSMGWQPPLLLLPVGIDLSGVEITPAASRAQRLSRLSTRIRRLQERVDALNLPPKPPIIPKGQRPRKPPFPPPRTP